mmetsp:Transcript_15489/g.43356  ORF Transcript_15489/g.43356 Transcript_15489/m.43356 type:complete len:236 (-) Transcript_15489:896-1603(-)
MPVPVVVAANALSALVEAARTVSAIRGFATADACSCMWNVSASSVATCVGMGSDCRDPARSGEITASRTGTRSAATGRPARRAISPSPAFAASRTPASELAISSASLLMSAMVNASTDGADAPAEGVAGVAPPQLPAEGVPGDCALVRTGATAEAGIGGGSVGTRDARHFRMSARSSSLAAARVSGWPSIDSSAHKASIEVHKSKSLGVSQAASLRSIMSLTCNAPHGGRCLAHP